VLVPGPPSLPPPHPVPFVNPASLAFPLTCSMLVAWPLNLPLDHVSPPSFVVPVILVPSIVEECCPLFSLGSTESPVMRIMLDFNFFAP